MESSFKLMLVATGKKIGIKLQLCSFLLDKLMWPIYVVYTLLFLTACTCTKKPSSASVYFADKYTCYKLVAIPKLALWV